MSMEASAISGIATPQGHGSPTKQRTYQYQIRTSSENMQAYTMGEKRVHEEVQRRGRPDAQADVDCAGSSNVSNDRVSTSSTGSSDTERTGELAAKMRNRRKVVDEMGSHWESPSLEKSSAKLSKDQRDPLVAKTLFDDKAATPEKSPDKEIESELKTTPPRATETTPRTPRGTEEEQEESRATPTRRRRTSRQKLLDAAATKLQQLTDEQLTSLTVLMGGQAKTDDTSNCSSSERSSEDSPPTSKARATSAPAGSRVEFYEATPQYPELRKKRLSGQRAITPMKVRFEGEEEELNGSDDDIPTATSTIGIKAARRLSRGPTGEIVPVNHDDSPTKSEDNENRGLTRTDSEAEITLSEAASAAVDGAKGAVWGGVTGAAVGVTGALFTFGLSIPVCAVAGATYHGYNRIVTNLQSSRSRENLSESSNVRTSSAPPMSARRQ